jgi:hypothetical protein
VIRRSEGRDYFKNTSGQYQCGPVIGVFTKITINKTGKSKNIVYIIYISPTLIGKC